MRCQNNEHAERETAVPLGRRLISGSLVSHRYPSQLHQPFPTNMYESICISLLQPQDLRAFVKNNCNPFQIVAVIFYESSSLRMPTSHEYYKY
jgi:hypothetical protein